MVRAYIGIGSNLHHPLEQVRQALVALAQLPVTALARTSSLYRSQPMGPQEQADYINAVAAMDTELSAEQLLTAMQLIEYEQGRIRSVRWGSRTLDLDLLLYGDEIIVSDHLVVPHPGIKERDFVLYPLAEIASDLILPTGEAVCTLKLTCPSRAIAKLVER